MASWFKNKRLKSFTAVIIILVAAILPSICESYIIFSRVGSILFYGSDRNISDWIKLNTSNRAVFLTSDDIIHYVPSLSGRRVVNGAYTWQTGFETPEIRENVKRMYFTGDEELLRKYKVTHVLIGPDERKKYIIREKEFEKRYKLVYNQASRGRIYKIFDIEQKNHQINLDQRDIVKNSGTFLSDLYPTKAQQSHGKLQYDANFNLEPIKLKDKIYLKGLGTHANSEIIFTLKKGFNRFESDIGLDDTEARSPGSVIFKVYVDGKQKYKSQVIRWNSKTERVKINVTNSDELKLVVEDAGDFDTCDHASWAGAILY